VRRTLALTLLPALFAAGCGVAHRAGIKLYYKPAAIAPDRVVRDVPYVEGSIDPRHRLNFFKPATREFPIVIFIHGGNWDSGDKDYRFGGQDIYNNIGRFLAARGIGCAVISYRLIPAVNWREQAGDAARAIAWTHKHATELGGDPNRLFLMGHSAGAQLAMRTVLDRVTLEKNGVPRVAIRGVIGVAGAGYDMADRLAQRLGADPAWYAKRFRLGPADADWQVTASPVQLVDGDPPPALLVYADGESVALKRQSELMRDILNKVNTRAQLVVVPGLSHTRIVPTLSREDRPAGAAVLAFIRKHA
jgi:acetyl esterase/lipase